MAWSRKIKLLNKTTIINIIKIISNFGLTVYKMELNH